MRSKEGETLKIYIKNMVCDRCIMVVDQILRKLRIEDADLKFGIIETKKEITEEQLLQLTIDLATAGFEIINSQTGRLVEQINTISIEYVYSSQIYEKAPFSNILSGKLNRNYNYLSSLYSSFTGTTIEKHLIKLKIERVKELLVYDEKTLSEIAFEMGYSSVAHLSGQFKKISGFSPSYFKRLREQKRKSIDNI